ncbi:uncharacterized protein LOC118416118 isoform X1 [Branchiostoma floridae]|uniref:Uncharacterized protein LOC118416118 isoform X1 n=1 Tax=Branchiostoma floridae TaxID=7739 RepID=A0A9J7L844_BRAFL|nr:uncharacterized protein LOC118416118 isoform X1 [Branchiostoma floridae]
MLRLLLSLTLVAAAWCAPGIAPAAKAVPANKLSTTVTAQGCFYLGNHYRPGEVVLSEPGCYGRTYTCEASGIQGHGIPGDDLLENFVAVSVTPPRSLYPHLVDLTSTSSQGEENKQTAVWVHRSNMASRYAETAANVTQ